MPVGGLAGYSMAMQKIRINKVIEEIQILSSFFDEFSLNYKKGNENFNYRDYADSSHLAEALATAGGKLSSIGSSWEENSSYYLDLTNISNELCLSFISQLDDETGPIRVGNTESARLKLNSEEARNICQKEEGADGLNIFLHFGYR